MRMILKMILVVLLRLARSCGNPLCYQGPSVRSDDIAHAYEEIEAAMIQFIVTAELQYRVRAAGRAP
jgi:hypothetical protein